MVAIRHAFAVDATTLSYDSPALCNDGVVDSIILVCPNYTNNVTTHVSLVDDEGNVYYTSAEKNRNATYLISSVLAPIDRSYKVRIVLSGVAGGSGGSSVVKLFVR